MLLNGMLADLTLPNDISVTNITLDSSEISPGSIFLSLAKKSEQRLLYLKQAIENGAVAVAYDSKLPMIYAEKKVCLQYNVGRYSVDNLSHNAGRIAARFYQYPSERITVIGITGTNGKTSVSQLIAQAFELLNIPCGIIGTPGIGRIDNLQSNGMTTPNPVTLQMLLANFEKQEIHHVVIEVSSHALDQGRLNGVDIDIAVLTHLSRDHLDYHQTMEHYAKAKYRLFQFNSIKHMVINLDDKFGKKLAKQVDSNKVHLLTYGSRTSSQHKFSQHIQSANINATLEGISFTLKSNLNDVKIYTSLIGDINVSNLLAVTQVLLASGTNFKDTVKSINKCHAVDGRMKLYGKNKQVHVVIDYAHTPDALSQALTSLRKHLDDRGKLWCVFGCGGDRDKGKRALMGARAENNADKIVLTSDNPRDESNEEIIKDILVGIKRINNIYIEHNRQQAINYAINMAAITDIVLITGKGHEKYQIISGIKYPFNDSQVVINALMAVKNNTPHVRVK